MPRGPCLLREYAYKRAVHNTRSSGWWLNGGLAGSQGLQQEPEGFPVSRVSALDRLEHTTFLAAAHAAQEQSVRLSAGSG